MTTFVMLDIETVSKAPSAVILSLGAVKFDPYTETEPTSPFYHLLDFDQQVELGRDVNAETLEWWGKQPANIQAACFGDEGRTKVEDFLKEFNRYLVGVDRVWAQGIVFDFGILENLYWMMKTPKPWKYNQVRDSRTLFDLGYDPRREMQVEAHNALADAYFQARAVQKVYKRLNITKE